MKRIIRLTESDLTRIVRRIINEQQSLTPITIDIPAQKNEKGVLKAIPNARVSFQIINQKGTEGEMTDDYDQISMVHWGNGEGAKASSSKDGKGNIIGSFAPNEAGLKELVKLVGQKDMTGNLGMKVTRQPGNQFSIASPVVRFKERPIQTESDLSRIVKRVIRERYEDDYTASGFDKMGDASYSSLKSKGFSHRGKEESGEFFIMFDGDKFYEGDFEIADYNDTGDIPRVEGGKLIIANPAWGA